MVVSCLPREEAASAGTSERPTAQTIGASIEVEDPCVSSAAASPPRRQISECSKPVLLGVEKVCSESTQASISPEACRASSQPLRPCVVTPSCHLPFSQADAASGSRSPRTSKRGSLHLSDISPDNLVSEGRANADLDTACLVSEDPPSARKPLDESSQFSWGDVEIPNGALQPGASDEAEALDSKAGAADIEVGATQSKLEPFDWGDYWKAGSGKAAAGLQKGSEPFKFLREYYEAVKASLGTGLASDGSLRRGNSLRRVDKRAFSWGDVEIGFGSADQPQRVPEVVVVEDASVRRSGTRALTWCDADCTHRETFVPDPSPVASACVEEPQSPVSPLPAAAGRPQRSGRAEKEETEASVKAQEQRALSKRLRWQKMAERESPPKRAMLRHFSWGDADINFATGALAETESDAQEGAADSLRGGPARSQRRVFTCTDAAGLEGVIAASALIADYAQRKASANNAEDASKTKAAPQGQGRPICRSAIEAIRAEFNSRSDCGENPSEEKENRPIRSLAPPKRQEKRHFTWGDVDVEAGQNNGEQKGDGTLKSRSDNNGHAGAADFTWGDVAVESMRSDTVRSAPPNTDCDISQDVAICPRQPPPEPNLQELHKPLPATPSRFGPQRSTTKHFTWGDASSPLNSLRSEKDISSSRARLCYKENLSTDLVNSASGPALERSEERKFSWGDADVCLPQTPQQLPQHEYNF
eukprot:TRINITY_DN8588_c0_g1_i2.p1 TRINITY_DN8588_c0_g1~~TRINITY_DN8588_c0_g1_i2.p1  ORF type:complete len:705 (-),score=123.39 TRINITY_DN8588_c0_g1_i2:286-2400(-)